MRIKLDKGAFLPNRAHPLDGGLDICAMYDGVVWGGNSAVFHTGVHVELPPGTAGLVVSRSGLMVAHDITSTGLIDESYQGEIVVKLFNHGTEKYMVKAGDRISQLVVIPVMTTALEPIEVVEDFGVKTYRGEKGFGSSGK